MAIRIWRVDSEIYVILTEILADMLEEDDWSEPYMVLLDQLKSLPGYPLTMSEETDTLVVEEVGVIQSLPTVQN